jgi:quinol monooxygenase YgiN
MGRVVIVAYKPKPDRADELKQLMQTHLPRLKQQGLVRDKESYIMEAADGTIVEVFEWLSEEAIQNAHTNATVQDMWREYAEVCTYATLTSLPEAANLFAGFTPLN